MLMFVNVFSLLAFLWTVAANECHLCRRHVRLVYALLPVPLICTSSSPTQHPQSASPMTQIGSCKAAYSHRAHPRLNNLETRGGIGNIIPNCAVALRRYFSFKDKHHSILSLAGFPFGQICVKFRGFKQIALTTYIS